jgi:PIN domain nuclease of toxin-antitoxin system
MKLLLDTHIYLWWLLDAEELSARARELISTCETAYVSTVSIWEAGIKWQAGKLTVPPEELADGISQSRFTELPVTMPHALTASKLPFHHRDPFDRMLIAQAIAEPLHLITSDKVMENYSSLIKLV